MSTTTKIDDGGPAFPHYNIDTEIRHPGISTRDWFAGKALAGIMANPSIIAPRPDCGWSPCNCSFDDLADLAIEQADRMIEKLMFASMAQEWITRKIYRGTDEHTELLQARFPANQPHGGTFMFQGHRWRYKLTHFDDRGDYDVIERPNVERDENAAS